MESRVSSGGDKLIVMEGYAYPSEIDAQIQEAGRPTIQLELEVRDDGRLECKRFTLIATDDHPEVVAQDLRMADLSKWRDYAVEKAAKPVIRSEGGTVVMGLGLARSREPVHLANRRRKRVTPEALRRVAEIVREHPKGAEARDDALASEAAYV